MGVKAYTGKGAELESRLSWPTADLCFTHSVTAVRRLLGNEETGAASWGQHLGGLQSQKTSPGYIVNSKPSV